MSTQMKDIKFGMCVFLCVCDSLDDPLFRKEEKTHPKIVFWLRWTNERVDQNFKVRKWCERQVRYRLTFSCFISIHLIFLSIPTDDHTKHWNPHLTIKVCLLLIIKMETTFWQNRFQGRKRINSVAGYENVLLHYAQRECVCVHRFRMLLIKIQKRIKNRFSTSFNWFSLNRQRKIIKVTYASGRNP